MMEPAGRPTVIVRIACFNSRDRRAPARGGAFELLEIEIQDVSGLLLVAERRSWVGTYAVSAVSQRPGVLAAFGFAAPGKVVTKAVAVVAGHG